MIELFADFHIHVGFSESGHWVKIPTSRRLTLRHILETAQRRKGLQVIGVVDALSPWVLDDMERLISEGLLTLQPGGGYRFGQELSMIPGAEIETVEPAGGVSHTLVFLPSIEAMRDFSRQMASHIRNIHLSSQNAHMPLSRLVDIAVSHQGLVIPAHVFTPFKSVFGACTDKIGKLLSDAQFSSLAAIELGLSADTGLADRLTELETFSFLSNSDAHSPDKIGREYNLIRVEEPTFDECAKAFRRQDGRSIIANYGLDPRLGKYHCSFCLKCDQVITDCTTLGQCPTCGGTKLVRGVADRIEQIADLPVPRHPDHRPPYHYHLPLGFIPGLGPKTIGKLLDTFGTEMNLVHTASLEEVANIVGSKTATALQKIRRGESWIQKGGGGLYGRISIE